jgi:hypothetical protein
MELVRRRVQLEGVAEWGGHAQELVPVGTVFAPVVEKKYLINKVHHVST